MPRTVDSPRQRSATPYCSGSEGGVRGETSHFSYNATRPPVPGQESAAANVQVASPAKKKTITGGSVTSAVESGVQVQQSPRTGKVAAAAVSPLSTPGSSSVGGVLLMTAGGGAGIGQGGGGGLTPRKSKAIGSGVGGMVVTNGISTGEGGGKGSGHEMSGKSKKGVDEPPLGFEPEGSEALNEGPKEQLTPRVLSPPLTNGNTVTTGGGGIPTGAAPMLLSGLSSAGTGTSTPGYRAWSDSVDALLNDADGVKLFREFLEINRCVHLHDFYLAWKCMADPDIEKGRLVQLIPIMYRKFIKSSSKVSGGGGANGTNSNECKVSTTLNLTQEVCDSIKKESKRWSMTSTAEEESGSAAQGPPLTIFDEVISKVLEHFSTLKRDFLQSDLYTLYVNGLMSPGRVTNSGWGGGKGGRADSPDESGGESPVRGSRLEPVPEHQVLDLGQTKASGQRTYELVEQLKERLSNGEDPEKVYVSAGRLGVELPSPYKFTPSSGFLPVSAVDSEAGSMSSEALTDDTLTETNSSVDGFALYNSRSSRRQHRHMIRRSALRNQDTHLTCPPPNPSLPKNPRLAETDPGKFSEEIIRRLQKYLDEELRKAKDEELKKKLFEGVEKEEPSKDKGPTAATSSHHHTNTLEPPSKTSNNELRRIFSSMAVGEPGASGDSSDLAQNILDNHCQRVWDKSEQQTPATQTPQRAKSPHRHRPTAGVGLVGAGTPGALPGLTAVGPAALMGASGSAVVSAPGGVVGVMGGSGGAGGQTPVKTAKKKVVSSGATAGTVALPGTHPAQPVPSDLKVSGWIVANMTTDDIMEGGKQRRGGSSSKRAPSTSNRDRGKATSTSDRGKGRTSESQRSTSSTGRRTSSQRPGSESAGNTATSGGGSERGGGASGGGGGDKLGVVIYILDEPIPYSMEHPEKVITLNQFKLLVSHKKNTYRYFFKKSSEGFPTGVWEKIEEDDAVLPTWEGRVIGKINELK